MAWDGSGAVPEGVRPKNIAKSTPARSRVHPTSSTNARAYYLQQIRQVIAAGAITATGCTPRVRAVLFDSGLQQPSNSRPQGRAKRRPPMSSKHLSPSGLIHTHSICAIYVASAVFVLIDEYLSLKKSSIPSQLEFLSSCPYAEHVSAANHLLGPLRASN